MIGEVLLVQCELQLIGLLFTEEASSLSAKVNTFAPDCGISSALRPKAVAGNTAKPENHVLGEYLKGINFQLDKCLQFA